MRKTIQKKHNFYVGTYSKRGFAHHQFCLHHPPANFLTFFSHNARMKHENHTTSKKKKKKTIVCAQAQIKEHGPIFFLRILPMSLQLNSL